jgi:hypothetical protein
MRRRIDVTLPRGTWHDKNRLLSEVYYCPYEIHLRGRGYDILESWRLTNFEDLNQDRAQFLNDDTDGDSLSNFVEFAFGLNPQEFSHPLILSENLDSFVRGTPLVRSTETGMRVYFLRRKDRTETGLTYRLQFSSTLITWQNVIKQPTLVTSDEEVELLSLDFPPPTNRSTSGFFRVVIGMP